MSDGEQERPLEGITVLDLASGLAAPYASLLLADFGAEVISIERPGGGPQRTMLHGGHVPNAERNKSSLVLDLKKNGAEKILEDLISTSDVFLHNFTPGAMDRLGYTYDTVNEINDKIIYCSVTGYGDEGPYSNRPAFDPLVQAMSGMMVNTGEPDRKPSRVGASPHDHGTGIFTAFGIMIALWNRERTGEGQKIETSLFDTAAAFMNYWYTYYSRTGKTPKRQGHSWEGYAPVGIFCTKDDPVYLSLPRQHLWERFCDALNKPEWLDNPKYESVESRVENREALENQIENEFKRYSRTELIEDLTTARIPIAEVQTIPEAATDEHLLERGTLTTLTDVDGAEVTAVKTPINLSETPPAITRGPASVGEHTVSILEALGYSDEEIQRLKNEEVVF